MVRRQRIAALAAGAAFVVVLAVVATGAGQSMDRAVADWFRPQGEWGTAQVRLGPVIDGLEPRRAYAFLALVAAILCLRRHSRRPAVFAGLVAVTTIGSTSLIKVATHRADPYGGLASTGGSFPSGHVVALVASLGCCALMCSSRTRWWHWAVVAAAPVLMAAALLYAGAHWMTDILGGTLLAVAILCWAASLPLRAAATRPRRRPARADPRRRTTAAD